MTNRSCLLYEYDTGNFTFWFCVRGWLNVATCDSRLWLVVPTPLARGGTKEGMVRHVARESRVPAIFVVWYDTLPGCERLCCCLF